MEYNYIIRDGDNDDMYGPFTQEEAEQIAANDKAKFDANPGRWTPLKAIELMLPQVLREIIAEQDAE